MNPNTYIITAKNKEGQILAIEQDFHKSPLHEIANTSRKVCKDLGMKLVSIKRKPKPEYNTKHKVDYHARSRSE